MIEPALAALAPERRRLDALIGREVRRLRARYELSLDEFRGLYIGDQQVDALLRDPGATDPGEEAPDVSGARASDAGTRWAHVARVFGLDDDERDVTLVPVGPGWEARRGALAAAAAAAAAAGRP